MSLPRITAIVVVHGASRAQLQACLGSLTASDNVDLDVVLVDNASPDGAATSREVAAVLSERAPIMVSEQALNRGFAAGVNAGLSAARGELVWVMNDDATVAPDTLARCASALVESPADVIAVAPVVHLEVPTEHEGAPVIDSAGLVLRPNGEAFSAGLGQPDLGQYRTGEPCLGPCFVAGMFRATAFEPEVVGRLDERYFLYYEDVDWAVRAALAGHRVTRLAASGVVHRHAGSTRKLGEARRYRLVQRNLLVFATLNLSGRQAVSVWVGRLVVHAKGLLTGPYRWSRVAALMGALRRLPRAVTDRRERRAGAVLPEHELFRFAQDEEPFLEAGTFRVKDPDAADAAARRRLASPPPP